MKKMKEILINDLLIYRLLMWSHWFYAVAMGASWLTGGEVDSYKLTSVIMIAILAGELVAEKKKNDS